MTIQGQQPRTYWFSRYVRQFNPMILAHGTFVRSELARRCGTYVCGISYPLLSFTWHLMKKGVPTTHERASWAALPGMPCGRYFSRPEDGDGNKLLVRGGRYRLLDRGRQGLRFHSNILLVSSHECETADTKNQRLSLYFLDLSSMHLTNFRRHGRTGRRCYAMLKQIGFRGTTLFPCSQYRHYQYNREDTR